MKKKLLILPLLAFMLAGCVTQPSNNNTPADPGDPTDPVDPGDPTDPVDPPSKTESDGVAGNNASETGTLPSGAQKLTFTFNDQTISGISATSSSSPDASATFTVNSYQFAGVQVIKHAESNYITPGYLGLCTKQNKTVSSIANKTAMPGNIKKIEFTMPSDVSEGSGSVSALAPFVVDFGTAELSSTTLTGGKTGGSGVTFEVYPTKDVKFFSISCVQGVSSTGKATWYNGYISELSVYYA